QRQQQALVRGSLTQRQAVRQAAAVGRLTVTAHDAATSGDAAPQQILQQGVSSEGKLTVDPDGVRLEVRLPPRWYDRRQDAGQVFQDVAVTARQLPAARHD